MRIYLLYVHYYSRPNNAKNCLCSAEICLNEILLYLQRVSPMTYYVWKHYISKHQPMRSCKESFRVQLDKVNTTSYELKHTL